MSANSIDNKSTHAIGLYLKGSIFFDSDGREILKNKNGKSYLMDQQIKTLWKSVESIMSKPGLLITNINDLFSMLPPHQRTNESERLLKKFVELELIGVH